MLLDIINTSQEDEKDGFDLVVDEEVKINMQHIPRKSAIIGLKEYKEYSTGEEQMLISSDQELQIKNLNTQIDSRKGFFQINSSWK